LKSNVGVRALAVLLAFLLWFHVVTNKEYEYDVSIPIVLEGLESGLMLASEFPEKCRITVKGTGKQLMRFLVEADSASIDASSYSTGLYVVEPEPLDLLIEHRAGGVDIVEIVEPKKLRLLLEERMEKLLPVVSDIDVSPALGYLAVGDLMIDPDSVTVVGPKRYVRKLDWIKTEDISFNEINSSLKEKVKLVYSDSSFLTLSEVEVEVQQSVMALVSKTYNNVPVGVVFGNDSLDVEVFPGTVSIVVEALSEAFDSLTDDSFSATISLGAEVGDSVLVKPSVSIPTGVRLVEVKPSEILLRSRPR